MAAARAGDGDAMESLLSRHYDRIHHICRRITGNDTDALDAAQESLLAIVRGLSRFDQRSSFTTWAYRVATNACLDELRRRRRRPAPGLPPEGTGALVLTGSAGWPDLDQAVAERLDVDAALGRLSPTQRAAVVLRDVCAMSYEEVADTLGLPIGTVRSRISRGRAAVADELSARARSGTRPSPRAVQPREP